jgi:beta-galactosidase
MIKTDRQLGESYTAIKYADWIKPAGAKVFASYDQPHLKKYAAVTRNEFGKGVGWYVGTIANEPEFYDRLIASLLKDAKVRQMIEPPAGVEVATRTEGERGLLFVINHTAEEKTVAVSEGSRELLTDADTEESIKLEPFGVAVIELQSSDSR